MGITPKDPADFAPNMGSYTDLKPFRFWCQKVLPLVYDDSLSYYEVLCKVVDYLNKAMEDIGVLHGDVEALNTAYQQLQAYVNDYFSTLDVQQEINNKLDIMAADGTLDALLLPYFNAYKSEINAIVSHQNETIDQISDDVDNFKYEVDSEITAQNANITVLQERMDGFSHLAEGSTTGDAELTDIRVGANGVTYPTAGDAVRAQDTFLNKKTNYEENALFNGILNSALDWTDGSIDSTTGQNVVSTLYKRTQNYIKVTTDSILTNTTGEIITVYNYDANYNYLDATTRTAGQIITGTDNTAFVRFRVVSSANTNNITVSTPIQLFSSLDNLSVKVEEINNNVSGLFDGTIDSVFDWEVGSIDTSTGADAYSVLYKRTKNYLQVSNKSILHNESQDSLTIYKYDDEYNFLGAELITDGQITDGTDDTVYIRFRVVVDFDIEGVGITTSISPNLDSIEKNLDSLNTGMATGELPVIYEWEDGSISTSTGQDVDNNLFYRTKGYYTIQAGQGVSNMSNITEYLFYYDENYEHQANAVMTAGQVLTLDSQYTYYRIRTYKSIDSLDNITSSQNILDDIIVRVDKPQFLSEDEKAQGRTNLGIIQASTNGLKLAIIGDSLSAQEGSVPIKYHDLLHSNNDYEVTNVAISGSSYTCGSLKYGRRDHQFYNQALQVPTDTDAVIIFGSFNDISMLKGEHIVYNSSDDIVDTGSIENVPGSTATLLSTDNVAPHYYTHNATDVIPIGTYKMICDGVTYQFTLETPCPIGGKIKIHLVTLGTIGADDNDVNTIVGAFATTIKNLYTRNNGMIIGIVTPTPWFLYNTVDPYGTENLQLCTAYVNKLRELAKHFMLPMLDLYVESNLRPWNAAFRDTYYNNSDGVHPNNDGHARFIYPHMRDFIHQSNFKNI